MTKLFKIILTYVLFGVAFAAHGQVDIVNIYTNAGVGMILSNTASVYNIGTNVATSASLKNSNFIFNWGTGCLQNGETVGAYNIFNLGFDAGWDSFLSSAGNLMNIGFYAGESATVTSGSHSIMNIGFGAGTTMNSLASSWMLFAGNSPAQNSTMYHCQNIYALGGGFQDANLSWCRDMVALGQTPGSSLTGSYTNVVLIGNGAAPTASTGKNQVILGPSMELKLGTGGNIRAADGSAGVTTNVVIGTTTLQIRNGIITGVQ